MRKRFTERAQRIVLIAQEEAKRLNNNYVGTEHILLGLIAVGEGVAVRVLSNLGVDLRRVRHEVEEIVGTGETVVVMDEIPFTPRAKNILDYAEEEAQHMGHSYIGTEHLLLGILREDEGVAARVLENLGLRLEVVREEVLNVLGEKRPDVEPGPSYDKGELVRAFVAELLRSHLPITAVEAAIDAARSRIRADGVLEVTSVDAAGSRIHSGVLDVISAHLVDSLFE